MGEIDLSFFTPVFSYDLYFPNEDNITQEIESFSQLPDGWDYGEGIAASKKTCVFAKLVYLLGKSYGYNAEPHAETNGDITIIFSMKDHFIDVEISNIEKFIMRYEIGRGSEYVVVAKDLEVSFIELEKVLIEIRNACQHFSSGQLTSNNIAAISRGSKIKRYSAATAEESRFSIRNVQNSNQAMSVTI
jgi:hypothetical protein